MCECVFVFVCVYMYGYTLTYVQVVAALLEAYPAGASTAQKVEEGNVGAASGVLPVCMLCKRQAAACVSHAHA